MIARSTSPENSSTETPAKSHIVLESFKSRPFCILCLLTLESRIVALSAFPGHMNTVSCLCFRHGISEVYSDSFGHQDEILAIDALRKERALTLGRDRTMLLHKMSETSCTIYRAPASSLESCCFINDTEYLSGSDKNGLLKKIPVFLLKNAHSVVAGGITTNENGDHDCVEYSNSSTTSSWVSSAAVGSDFAASGAGNGFVHLMVVEASALWIFIQASTDWICELYGICKIWYAIILSYLPFFFDLCCNCYGFCDINMLQETRFGRWRCIKSVQNGVAIHPLRLS
ncbi:LOW QUALITY PROTEIN: hypothetical protein HID58_028521 [Brassica napus]|uniref:Uncharacterized protein n=1 Tax=Brassica napus TaxID=3708 RepID=A0ABQ8CAG8_BRANA|nr:LOW QUALITY PROTEIN: hypothetical protein HID58_028521 [Brassica napus]